MFGKMFLAVAAAAVLPLSAATVFELKFDGNKANWNKCENYLKLVEIENKAFEGAEMATVFTRIDKKATKGDTSFSAQTPVFNVEGKSKIVISGEVYSTIDLKYTGGRGTCNGVRLADPKVVKVYPIKISTPKKGFTKFTAEVPVTKEMKNVYVQLGFDDPNLQGNNVVAIKALKVTVE